MPIARTGIVLYTLAYEACVRFYAEVLRLPQEFATATLTCFSFGGSYLMVEIDDEHQGPAPAQERTRTCLRLNVDDVYAHTQRVRALGIDVDYREHSWGTVAKFCDPDGNLIAFKDEEGYLRQRGIE